jgi:hypothetical protein
MDGKERKNVKGEERKRERYEQSYEGDKGQTVRGQE